MKLSKSFMKKILILILSVFVLVPIILMVFGLDKPMYEGFFNMDSDGYGDGASPPADADKITAIKAPGVGDAPGDISNENYTGIASGDKLYCVLGDITCADGYDASLVDTVDGVNTYVCKNSNNNTVDNTKATCNNSIFSDSAPFNGNSSVQFFKINENGCRDEDDTGFHLKSFESQYTSSSNFDISGNLDHFTGAYNTVPLKFTSDGSGDYVILQQVINDTNWKDISLSTCFMFKDAIDCEQNYASCSELQATGNNASESSSDNPNKLDTRCLGDFGDGVGDKLCCGQTGVIQNEHAKYTCPESHPYCRGYKCGDSWGACYSVENED